VIETSNDQLYYHEKLSCAQMMPNNMSCGSGRYSIHLSTWERSHHHHHYRHLRKTEITDDERVVFCVRKRATKKHVPEVRPYEEGVPGSRDSGIVGRMPRVIELLG
jgi:hypothetical protein